MDSESRRHPVPTFTWDCPCCEQTIVAHGGQDLGAPITKLWHEYRAEEKVAWKDHLVGFPCDCAVTWDDYKAAFSRFPSFPDWLRARGHLG